ncbi:MAG: urease accessory protein UreE [Gammaproteobacteria bacterium]|nr:urease accessory protein UreE [Gammaproteobacteria bacterium]
MLRFTHKTTGTSDLTLTLSYELRQKSRQRVELDNGEGAGLFLERGIILREGDNLATDEGDTVMIKAAKEAVSTVYCADALQQARACYHLGNRHVTLQISEKFIRYQTDHVLDELCQRLGLKVLNEKAPFEPEPGAYGDYGHVQGHSHSHAQGHSHSHEHESDREHDH